MIDSHAHLSMYPTEERRDVLARAADAGVGLILAPATGPEDLEEVADLPLQYPAAVVIALGFHPHEASRLDSEWKRRLQRALEGAGVVAVGEIGLDYYYENSPREDQRRAFSWQLALAVERNLPVVLHQREAWGDFLAGIDNSPGLRGVAHSFTEGAAGVEQLGARGLWIGISGMVTFPRADNVRQAAKAVVPERLLVETDSPYLAPVPFRGRRNEPAHVRVVARSLATLRGVEPEEVERQTTEAFHGLFTPRSALGSATRGSGLLGGGERSADDSPKE